jgi:hypothetical protein
MINNAVSVKLTIYNEPNIDNIIFEIKLDKNKMIEQDNIKFKVKGSIERSYKLLYEYIFYCLPKILNIYTKYYYRFIYNYKHNNVFDLMYNNDNCIIITSYKGREHKFFQVYNKEYTLELLPDIYSGMNIKVINKNNNNVSIQILFESNDTLNSLQKKISKSILESDKDNEPQCKYLIDLQDIVITHTIYYYENKYIELSENPFNIIYNKNIFVLYYDKKTI